MIVIPRLIDTNILKCFLIFYSVSDQFGMSGHLCLSGVSGQPGGSGHSVVWSDHPGGFGHVLQKFTL